MGYNATACTVLGVPFDPDDLDNTEKKQSQKIRGCAHAHSGKFCPECGKPAYVIKTIVVQEAIESPDTGEPIKTGYWKGLEFVGRSSDIEKGVLGIVLGRCYQGERFDTSRPVCGGCPTSEDYQRQTLAEKCP